MNYISQLAKNSDKSKTEVLDYYFETKMLLKDQGHKESNSNFYQLLSSILCTKLKIQNNLCPKFPSLEYLIANTRNCDKIKYKVESKNLVAVLDEETKLLFYIDVKDSKIIMKHYPVGVNAYQRILKILDLSYIDFYKKVKDHLYLTDIGFSKLIDQSIKILGEG